MGERTEAIVELDDLQRIVVFNGYPLQPPAQASGKVVLCVCHLKDDPSVTVVSEAPVLLGWGCGFDECPYRPRPLCGAEERRVAGDMQLICMSVSVVKRDLYLGF